MIRLSQDTEGSGATEYVVSLVVVALVGFAGLETLGGSFGNAIGQETEGRGAGFPVAVGAQASVWREAAELARGVRKLSGAADLPDPAVVELASTEARRLHSLEEIRRVAAELSDEEWRPRLAPGIDPDAKWKDLPLVAVDFEGAQGRAHEIGLAEIDHGALLDSMTVRVAPEGDLPQRATELRKLEGADDTSSPVFAEKIDRIVTFLEGRVPFAYNYSWDAKQLLTEWEKLPHPPANTPAAAVEGVEWIDVLDWVRMLRHEPSNNSLSAAFRRITGEELVNAHAAEVDARATARVLFSLADEMPETYGEVIRQQVAFRKLRRTIELAEEEAANVAHSATKTPKESQRVLDVAKDDRPARHLADAWNARGHWAKGRIASIDVRTAADGARPTEIGVALFDGGSLVTAKSFPISAKDGLTFDVVMRDVAAFTSADGAPYYPLAYNGVTHRFRLLDALERARSAGGLVDQAELPPLFSAPSYLDPLPWVREMLQSDGPATLEAIAPKLEVSLTNPLNSTERAIAAAQVAFKLEEKGVPRTLGRFLDDQHELRVARIERRPARLNGSGAAAVGVATEDTAPTALSKRIDGKAPWRNGRIVVVDFEATGPNPRSARIIEAGWAIFDDGKLVEKHSVLVDPGVRISDEVSELTGITNEMIKNGDPERGLQPGRPLEEVLPLLNAYWGDAQPVAHNVRYDRTILHAETDRLLESGKITEAPRWGVAFERDADWIDTLPLVKKVFSKGETENHRLGTMVDHMGIQLESWHRAGDDALAAGKLLLKLGERKLRHLSWEDLYALQKMSNKEYIALSEKEQAALRRTADIAAAAKKATAKKKSVAKAAEKVANKRPRN